MSHFDSDIGLTIRPMAEGDLDRVAAIAALLPTAPQWDRTVYAAAIAPERAPLRVALVAEADGEIVGFAIASVVAPESELEIIVMDGPAQGYGFGSSLMHAMIARLRLAGVDEVALEVRALNEAALAFYRRAGVEEVGRRRGYYREPVEDAVLLRLGLT
jgi:ribosomal-protein-alanine N-acetyltransferase